jgi:transposase
MVVTSSVPESLLRLSLKALSLKAKRVMSANLPRNKTEVNRYHVDAFHAKSNRCEPWDYDRELYKKRNRIERPFRRLKGFRRIFSRFEKLDVVFLAFVYFAFIVEALR